MIILVCMGAFALLSCIAAAGLIASTQNAIDAGRSLAGLTISSDESLG